MQILKLRDSLLFLGVSCVSWFRSRYGFLFCARKFYTTFLCSWFRASLIYINNCPTRCNTKQSNYYSASSLYMFRPTWPSYQCSLATLEGGSCTVPEAVVTVFCTPDDGRGWHLKHVEWICRILNRLLCVASRSATINAYLINNLTPHCVKTTYSLSWKITFLKEAHFYESYTNKVANIG